MSEFIAKCSEEKALLLAILILTALQSFLAIVLVKVFEFVN